MSGVDFLLFEASIGYSLFQVVQKPDSTALLLKETTDSIQDASKFRKLVKLVSFAPFAGAAEALSNANDLSEGLCSEVLKSFLEINLPKSGKKPHHAVTLGLTDKNLASSVKEFFPNIECDTRSLVVQELLRGVRTHLAKLLPELESQDVERGSLGLGHAYSRSRVKFSISRDDNHIIQAIATLDGLDKAINTFSMRIR
jgi:nucleolar protein 56